MTRRKLGAVLISSAALAQDAAAQTPGPAKAPPDPLQAAKDRVKTASEALAKEHVPMSTEPAFQFKV